MTVPQRVSLGEISHRPGRPNPWLVRWRVDGRDRARSHPTKAAASAYWRALRDAQDRGERFDEGSGLPISWKASRSILAFATEWYAGRWPRWGSKQRGSVAEALTIALIALTDQRIDPQLMGAARQWLGGSVFVAPGLRKTAPATPADRQARDWLEVHSLPVNRIGQNHVDDALEALSVRLDSDVSVAGTTFARRRAALHQLFKATVRDGLRSHNPVGSSEVKVPPRSREVDGTLLPSVAEANEIIDRIRQRGRQGLRLVAPLSTMLYAGLRPSEVAGLRPRDVTLPDQGWGRAILRGAVVQTGRRYTDDGSRVEERNQLKHRAAGAVRSVPLPPTLVAIIRDHIQTYQPDGHLFNNTRGGLWTTGLSRTWRETIGRLIAEDAEAWMHLESSTPYVLRHTHATVLLANGAPTGEIARRLGHSAEVLLEHYAGIIGTDEATTNARLEAAFRDGERG